MGVLGYEHQVWLDTEWLTKAEAAYEKNPKGIARPRYDRTSAALADALEDHALVFALRQYRSRYSPRTRAHRSLESECRDLWRASRLRSSF